MIRFKNIPSWPNVQRSVSDPAGVLDSKNPGNHLLNVVETRIMDIKDLIELRFGVQIEDIAVTFKDKKF